MYLIVIEHRNGMGTVEYKIYTREEADKLGIRYVYWWFAEAGQYALSDDDIVGKCITTKWYPASPMKRHSALNRYVKTAYGAAYWKKGRSSAGLYAKGRSDIHSLSGRLELHGSRKRHGLQIVELYARTMDMDYSIHEVLRNNPDWGYRNWKKWSTGEECKNMVRDELTKVLEAKGFSQAQTLQLLKETVALAKEKEDVKALVKIVENLTRMHGIDKPSQKKTKNVLEARKITGYLDDANKEEDLVEFRGTKTETITEFTNEETPVEEIVDE